MVGGDEASAPNLVLLLHLRLPCLMPGCFRAVPSLHHLRYACSMQQQHTDMLANSSSLRRLPLRLLKIICFPLFSCSAAAVSLSVPVCSVTNSPDPRPQGVAAIPVTAFVLPNTAAVGTVQLTYLVNYGSPVTIPMTAAAGMCSFAPAT